jgi:hypothetical protein
LLYIPMQALLYIPMQALLIRSKSE